MNEIPGAGIPEARYAAPAMPEHANNPLILALPPPLGGDRVAEILTREPDISPEDRLRPLHERGLVIDRVKRDFFAPQPQHLELEVKISTLMRESYLRRPPTPELTRFLNAPGAAAAKPRGPGNHAASSTSLIGDSGVGKSTAVNLILETYPEALFHPERGSLLQVPWLKIDSPHDGSVSMFCASFFQAMDHRIPGAGYEEKYMRAGQTNARRINALCRLCALHCVGLLVVDEFQCMDRAKSGGVDLMVDLLVNLINQVRVSVLIVGTPELRDILARKFRIARRVSQGGNLFWGRMEMDARWEKFLDAIWPFQYLQSPRARDESTTLALHDLTKGNPSMVVELFCAAQKEAVRLAESPADETLTAELFQAVASEQYGLPTQLLEDHYGSESRHRGQCGDLMHPDGEPAAGAQPDSPAPGKPAKPRRKRAAAPVPLSQLPDGDLRKIHGARKGPMHGAMKELGLICAAGGLPPG